MKEFTPPISRRSTEELIAIAHGTVEDWQQEAIIQAAQELKKRNISREEQDMVLQEWQELALTWEKAYQKHLKKNATESYSYYQMAFILLLAPFILMGRWPVYLSLSQLKAENYRKKYRQRLLLLMGGIAFWAVWIGLDINDNEKQRQEEIDKIEKADISAWEKSYYGTDSTQTHQK